MPSTPSAATSEPQPAHEERQRRFHPLEVFALVLLAYFALRWVGRGWLPPVTVVSQLLPFLLSAAVPLALVAFFLRRPRTGIALGLSGLAVYPLVVVPLTAGRADAAPASLPGERVRVLTFNLANDVASADDVIAFLAGSDADVVALQELSAENAAAIEERLGRAYPHQVLYGWGCPGAGILSRTPIVSHEWMDLSSPRPHLVAVIEVAGRELTLLNVHSRAWVGPFGSWSADARDWPALARIAAERAPALLVGDLNTTEYSYGYTAFPREGLVDAFRSVDRGFGFTFPIAGRYHRIPTPPFLRIDYVWHSPDLATAEAWIGPDASSDHYPLFAELVLPATTP